MQSILDTTKITLRKDLVLVHRYTMPERTPAGIIIPENYRERSAATGFWEPIKASPEVQEEWDELGITDHDMILQTERFAGVFIGLDEDLRDLYLISWAQVVKRTLWKESGDVKDKLLHDGSLPNETSG